MNKKDAQTVLEALGRSRIMGRDAKSDYTIEITPRLITEAIAILEAEVADPAKREKAQETVSVAIPTEKLPAPALLTTMTFAPDIGPPPVDLPIGLIEPAEASPEMVTPYISREHFDRAFPATLPKPLSRDDTEHGKDYFTASQMKAAYEAGLGAKPPLTFANERAQLEQEWSGVRKLKDALKARLRAAPEGYKLMPIKTTQPMRLVLMSADEHMPDDVYAALLAAAPEPDPIAQFVVAQEPLGAEFSKVLHDNLDSLYETGEPLK